MLLADDVAQPWLALQCRTLVGVSQGLVVQARPGRGAPRPVARWPKTESEASDLLGLARLALVKAQVVVRPSDTPAGSTRCWSDLALPFGNGRGFRGSVAVRIEHPARSGDEARKAAIDQLRAGAGWLEELIRAGSTRDRLVSVLEVLATALEHARLGAAATAVATELAARLGCERVSIGFTSRGQMAAEALSNTAKFDARSNAVQDLEAAMTEAADQDAPIIHPAVPGVPARVHLAHEALVKSCGAETAWTVPLGTEGRVIGAMTFERSGEGMPDAATIELCEDLGSLLGPILDLKRRARESWLEASREFFRRKLSQLRAPGHYELKAGLIACVAALLLICLARGDYRITADATLEGRVQRAIVAGIDGFIAEANVRAGDLLKQGQVMGRLDDRDLLLQQREGSGRRAQLVEEHWKALAEHDRSLANILRAKIDQIDAELGLVAAQIERTRLVAPFDGIVVKGDLSQELGSPVERGEVLFEIAPLDGYRIILKVDQRDIAEPSPGQPGQLALTALPGEVLPLTVERITPVSIAEDGRNYFRIEAHLDEPVLALRPGMEGVAKIDVDRRRLIWIWTHGLTDWLRLWIWSWLP